MVSLVAQPPHDVLRDDPAVVDRRVEQDDGEDRAAVAGDVVVAPEPARIPAAISRSTRSPERRSSRSLTQPKSSGPSRRRTTGRLRLLGAGQGRLQLGLELRPIRQPRDVVEERPGHGARVRGEGGGHAEEPLPPALVAERVGAASGTRGGRGRPAVSRSNRIPIQAVSPGAAPRAGVAPDRRPPLPAPSVTQRSGIRHRTPPALRLARRTGLLVVVGRRRRTGVELGRRSRGRPAREADRAVRRGPGSRVRPGAGRDVEGDRGRTAQPPDEAHVGPEDLAGFAHPRSATSPLDGRFAGHGDPGALDSLFCDPKAMPRRPRAFALERSGVTSARWRGGGEPNRPFCLPFSQGRGTRASGRRPAADPFLSETSVRRVVGFRRRIRRNTRNC